MTDPSATSTHRYRLGTFGALVLASPEDAAFLGNHGHHRRRLALLAVLAAAGDKGRSRDQLLLLFWPDATQARARHSLDQLLYALRNSLGESVFVGANPVRLNASFVMSDVGAFNAALEHGNLATAIEEYRGPFLDGFYLEDAPEFERWLETERARLATSYTGALEGLAQQAEAAQDPATVVRWRRKLVESDPVSSTHAAGLIRALMNAGDYPAALQFAERHEAIVAQELESSAGPAIASLVAEVRAKAKTEPVRVVKARPVPAGMTPPAKASTVGEGPAQQPRLGVSPRRSVSAYWIGALVIAVAVIGTTLWRRTAAGSNKLPAPAEPSVAVLPFANVSRDPADAAFVDGLTEEMIAALTKIRHLRVIPRASAFAFRNSNAGARIIADSLGVSSILEGGVQRIGSQLRVRVRLVDARDGSARWSATYDRELRDLFAVQSDIAGAVARSLDLQLGGSTLAGIKRGPTPSIAAYELYLRGNDPALLRSDSGARVGLEYYRQAIALDPGYAAAYAGLARMQLRVGVGDETVPRRDRLAFAEQAALKAVALDDSLGDAHAALSMVKRNNYDLASAETEMKRAVALEPTDARLLEWLVQLYIITERPTEALTAARTALALDPLSPSVNAELAHALFANDRCDEALAQLEMLRSLRPPLLRARSIAAQCYARKQMWPEAIAEMRRASMNAGPHGQAFIGYLLARAGRATEARAILAAVLARSRRINGGAFEVATVYAGLGDNDQAFRWLDRAVDDRSLRFDLLHPIVDGLPRDPRFDSFRRRAGLQDR